MDTPVDENTVVDEKDDSDATSQIGATSQTEAEPVPVQVTKRKTDTLDKVSGHSPPPPPPKGKSSSSCMTPDILEIPALGRSFQMGMLYDRRKDQLLPETLWDLDDMMKNVSIEADYQNNFEVIAGDSIQDKARAMGTDTNLQLSFYAGLLDVTGSACYLEDRKKSSQTARVTLKYSSTTRFEQLAMEYVNKHNVKLLMFEPNRATHVVVGIRYGSQAFMVFDKNNPDTKNVKQAENDLQKLVESLPNTDVNSEGIFIGSGTAQNVQCIFYGDFPIKRAITSFADAVNIYSELPQLAEKSVPMRVFLYPLEKTGIQASSEISYINMQSVKTAEDYFEELLEIEQLYNEVTNSLIFSQFPHLTENLSMFNELFEAKKKKMKDQMLLLLSTIRAGEQDEKQFAAYFEECEKSPISNHATKLWLQGKKMEIGILSTFFKFLGDIKFALANKELTRKLLSCEEVVCFKFCLNNHDKHLDAMKRHEKETVHSVEPKSPGTHFENNTLDDIFPKTTLLWYENAIIMQAMKVAAQKFLEFKETNPDLSFIITAVNNTNEGDGAAIVIYKGGGEEIHSNFKPPCQPGIPQIEGITFNTVDLVWSRPHSGSEFVKCYRIFHCETGGKTQSKKKYKWQLSGTSATAKFTVTDLWPNKPYKFKVQGICDVGVSQESEVSDQIITDKKDETLAELMFKHRSSVLLSSEKPCTYRLPLKLMLKDSVKKVRMYELFESQKTSIGIPHKVLMLTGATGSGKSTLLNGIANYLLGVQWSDPYRFQVITPEDEESANANNQAFSQTEYISAYTFHHQEKMPIPYNLTVIDTPGYGDCRGIKRDKEITEQIREFFTHEEGVDHLDGVCFITQAPGRLTKTQQYIIDSILSIFAKDVAENILLLITFADGQRPPVLDSVKEAKIPYRSSYKFNNSALFASNVTTPDSFTVDKMFWDMGMFNMKEFFDEVSKLPPKSLRLTKQVLQERQQLEVTIQGLQPQINQTILEMRNLEREKDILQKFECQINDNKNFIYEVDEQHSVKIDVPRGFYVTNCSVCNMTCHFECAYADSSEKINCWAMSNGRCRICPEKCMWWSHHNMPFKWITKTVKVNKEYAETKQQLEIAVQGKAGQEQVVEKMDKKHKTLKEKAYVIIKVVKNCLYRLGQIALRPNPLTTTDYIDVLIKSETQTHKRGWEERVQQLTEVRQKAELIEKIDKGEDVLE